MVSRWEGRSRARADRRHRERESFACSLLQPSTHLLFIDPPVHRSTLASSWMGSGSCLMSLAPRCVVARHTYFTCILFLGVRCQPDEGRHTRPARRNAYAADRQAVISMHTPVIIFCNHNSPHVSFQFLKPISAPASILLRSRALSSLPSAATLGQATHWSMPGQQHCDG